MGIAFKTQDIIRDNFIEEKADHKKQLIKNGTFEVPTYLVGVLEPILEKLINVLSNQRT